MTPHSQLPNGPQHLNNLPWGLLILGMAAAGGKKAIDHFERKIPWKVIASVGAAVALFLAGHGMQNTLDMIKTHSTQLAPLMSVPEQVKEVKDMVKEVKAEMKDVKTEIKLDHDKKIEQDNQQNTCLAEIKAIMKAAHPELVGNGGK